MAELKHTFVSGRMDKDRDERLVENGSYRDALNIHISSSEGSDVGAVENLLGNKQISNLGLTNPSTLGSVEYSLKNKIYWMVTSDTIDGIYEYDQDQNSVLPILIDIKTNGTSTLKAVTVESNDENELTLDNIIEAELKALCGSIPTSNGSEILVKNNLSISSTEPYIKISIPKNTVLRKEDDKFVFKNIEYNGKDFGNINLLFTYTLAGVLNFSKNNLITGINIIDNLLFWTDNLNPPRKINLGKFKKFSNNAFDTQTKVVYSKKNSSGNIEKQTRDFTEEDLSVAKKAPMYAPKLTLKNTLIDGVNDITESVNLFIDASLSNGGRRPIEIGEEIKISLNSALPNWQINAEVELFETNSADGVEALDAVGYVKELNNIDKTITIVLKTKNIDLEDKDYTLQITLIEDKPIYELSFVRFAYRWKYKDGEYSTMSPFSEVAFIPQEFRYDGKHAFNEGMENSLRKITLSDFDLGTDNIEEIEILFKETKNQNIYTLKAQKKIDFSGVYEITKKQIHSVLPNDQLLRSWDNVPKKAKSQEITANRIIYGNYTQNYDIYNDAEFNIKLKTRNDDLKSSIKSDRTYQIGVSYIDEYNRHSPILSSQSGSISISKDKAALQNSFGITLNSEAPAWAKYFKYYIKDISKEYYNLAADKIYTDKENGFSYVSFPSAERNKITEETYLLLKKQHGSNNAVLDSNNRYKVIEIFNEAPDFIAFRKKLQTTFQDVVFDAAFGDADGSEGSAIQETSGITPTKDNLKILIESLDSNSTGISNDAKSFLKPGNFIKFTADINKTQFYEISSVRFKTGVGSSSDHTVAELVFKTPFEDDVNILYDTDTNKTLRSNIGIEVHKTEGSKGDKEFDGKFFVKVEDNELLKDNSKESVGGKNYATIESLEVDGTAGIRSGLRFGKKALDNPKEPIFITKPDKNFDSSKYQFDIEETSNTQSNEYINLFKTGAKVKINNVDTVIELVVGNERLLDGVKPGSRRKGNITQKSVGFKNLDGSKYTIASFLIPNPGESKTLTIKFLKEIDDTEVLSPSNPAIFETEPIENITDLDIYYETEKAFDVSNHGTEQTLKWFNCFSFGNGVESNRIRDDFNAAFIDVGVKASSVISEQIKEEHKFNGLIWSGIINSRSGVNKSNEFNQANPITKDLLPSYGSIQKLHAWDDSIVILCEDKIVRALADKDILYNADGNPNVVATNKVIGAVSPYNGEYGISKNPESFAAYGFRCYFTDQTRGAVLRLSRDGLTPIDRILMSDFFSDRFFNTGCYNSAVDNSRIIGSYDDYNSLYNISFIGRDTVCFDEATNGWPTRKSFVPEFAISMNNTYYSYSNGELWEHDAIDVPHNNFYGSQYKSTIQLEINDNPSVIKSYKTLGYEGSENWTAEVVTDQQKSDTISFKEKENKYFAFVNGEKKDIENIDAKNFNFQGIGNAINVSSVSSISNTKLTFELSPKETEKYTSNIITINEAPGTKLNSTVNITIFPKNGYELKASNFNLNNVVATQDGNNVKLAYTHGIKTQPTRNTSNVVELCKINFAEQKNVAISGNYTVKLENVTSSIGADSYSISSNPNVLEIIKTRIITPNDGWKMQPDYITVNNKLIQLTKKINNDGSITLTERIVVPSVTTNNIDYEIKVIAKEIPVTKKKISSISINKSNITVSNTQRKLTISGDPDAKFTYKLTDSTSEIDRQTNLEIGKNGVYEIDINFPSADNVETFNIEILPGNGAELSSSISTSSLSILRPATIAKTLTVFSQFGSTISNKNKIQGFTGNKIVNTFTQEIQLAHAAHTILRQPTQSDFVFENNTDVVKISNLKMTYNAQHYKVTITGEVEIDNISVDNKAILILDNIINVDVTLTIEYNNTILGGAATTNYTDSTDYTITGPANLLANSAKEYLFTLTPGSGKEFISTINASDFEITDGSNIVTSTYALNDRIELILDNNLLKVGFIAKPFDLPSASKTISIRPKKQIAQTIAVVSDFSVLYEFLDQAQEEFTTSKIQGTLTNSANQDFLFQKVFTIDRSKINNFTQAFKSTGHTIIYRDSELTAATAGTYTDVNGNSITVTGQFELNNDKTQLTLNTLANINSNPSKQLGRIGIRLLTEFAGYHRVYLGEGGCAVSVVPNYKTRATLYTVDPLRATPKIGDYLVHDSKFGFSRLLPTLENTFKLHGTNLLITTIKETPTGFDKIKNIEVCAPPSDPDINIDDIVKTYGDANFVINPISNSLGSFTYTITNSSVATISGDVITITGAGDTVIKISQAANGNFNAGTKTISLKVRKANPIITAVDQNKTIGDADFTITIIQP